VPANAVQRLAHAVEFAAEKHIDQRRKGERAEPYVNHVAEVASLLAHATRGRDPNLVIAGLLHDTLEDTETTYPELVRHFGKDVADLVREVTDNKSHRWKQRKRLQIEHAAHASPRAKMLKIADKTANLRSLVHSAPVEWTEKRRDNYYVWAAKVVEQCRGVSPYLEREFDKAYAKQPKKKG